MVVAGDPFSYVVTVTNNGPQDVTNLVIDDTLLVNAGVSPSFVTVAISLGIFIGTTWTIDSLGAGASATATLTFLAPDGSAGSSYTNTAGVVSLDQVDPNSTNNSASVTTTVVAPDNPGPV